MLQSETGVGPVGSGRLTLDFGRWTLHRASQRLNSTVGLSDIPHIFSIMGLTDPESGTCSLLEGPVLLQKVIDTPSADQL